MENKNYLVIQNNIVTNAVVWDGDINKWTPPADAIMVVDEETPGAVWEITEDKTDYVLVEILGAGGIGFIWDGRVLTTPEPKPEVILDSPDNPNNPGNQIPTTTV